MKPYFEEYFTFDSRLDTYNNWKFLISKEKLCEAGFFSLQIEDSVQCFHCGLSIHKFEDGDDAWEEHALHSPHCHFVQQSRSKSFIINIAKIHTVELWLERGDVKTLLDLNAFSAEDIKNVLCEQFEKDLKFFGKYIDFYTAVKNYMFNKENGISQSKDKLLCKICYDKELSIIFLPCAHIYACDSCSAKLYFCSICRKLISGKIPVTFI